MPVPPLAILAAICVSLAWMGRHRLLGFWGNLILAFLAPPLVAFIVIAGAKRPKRPAPPVMPSAG